MRGLSQAGDDVDPGPFRVGRALRRDGYALGKGFDVDFSTEGDQAVERLFGVGRPVFGFLRGKFFDEGIDLGRQPVGLVGDSRHVVVDLLVRRGDGGLARERKGSGEELVEQDAQGVQVRPFAGVAVGDDLRGEIGHGSHDLPRRRRV